DISLLPHFDVLRAPPHALLIARQRANRKRATLFGGVSANAFINEWIALKNDFEDPLLMAMRIDRVMDMRRTVIVRIRRRLDGSEFVAPLRVGAHVTAQTRVAAVVGLRRVQPFGVCVIDVYGSPGERRFSFRTEYLSRHDQPLAWLFFRRDCDLRRRVLFRYF